VLKNKKLKPEYSEVGTALLIIHRPRCNIRPSVHLLRERAQLMRLVFCDTTTPVSPILRSPRV